MFEVDCARLYFCDDIEIKEGLALRVPRLKEIRDFGESLYFSYAQTIASVAADMKFQLWKAGVDYTTVEDYDFFIKYLFALLSSEGFYDGDRGLILKDLSFKDFDVRLNRKSNELVLYCEERDLIIDRIAYNQMADIVRQMHFWKRNNETPANEFTKRCLIEDAEDEYYAAKNRKFESVLLPYISGLRVISGAYGDARLVDDVGIYTLLYDARRAAHIQNADAMLHGAYGGFADMSKVDKKNFEIFGNIDFK